MQRCEKKINRCTASKELPLDERINLLWVPAWVTATTAGHHHPSWRPNTAWLILWSLPSLSHCPAHKTNPLLAIETDEGRPFAAAARHSGRPLPLCKQRVVDHPCLGCQGHLLFSTTNPRIGVLIWASILAPFPHPGHLRPELALQLDRVSQITSITISCHHWISIFHRYSQCTMCTLCSTMSL